MKKALVTGASEGIGREFAKQLAQEDYQITLVARNESRLKELVTELSGAGHKILIADLTKATESQKIAQELSSDHYNLLVNNAGFGVYGPFDSVPLSKLQEMMKLNIDALVELSHAFLQKAQSGDALINVSSALAFLPLPTSSLYAATKAFVTSFSESLWFEQKSKGVYVMDLCPGLTKTEFHTRAGGKEDQRPSESMTQTPDEVVKLAIRELSKRAKPTVVSGGKNVFATTLTRLMPRKTVVSFMGNARAK